MNYRACFHPQLSRLFGAEEPNHIGGIPSARFCRWSWQERILTGLQEKLWTSFRNKQALLVLANIHKVNNNRCHAQNRFLLNVPILIAAKATESSIQSGRIFCTKSKLIKMISRVSYVSYVVNPLTIGIAYNLYLRETKIENFKLI